MRIQKPLWEKISDLLFIPLVIYLLYLVLPYKLYKNSTPENFNHGVSGAQSELRKILYRKDGTPDFLALELYKWVDCKRISTEEFSRRGKQDVLLINIRELSPLLDQDEIEGKIYEAVINKHPEYCEKDEIVITYYTNGKFDIATTHEGCN